MALAKILGWVLFGRVIMVVVALTSQFNGTDYRLPSTLKPTNYAIDFTFTEETFTGNNSFTGTVNITVRAIEDTATIKLHLSHKYLTISEITLNGSEVGAVKNDSLTDTVTVTLNANQTIEKDRSAFLFVKYAGEVSVEDNYGIYKSSYTKPDKTVSYLLATQFEPTYARRAFPCFDEPAFKATFDVSITYASDVKPSLGVLFNTAMKGSPSVNEALRTTTVTFERTPIMSTYLVAFVVSDFTSSPGESKVNDDTAYTVWSRDDQKSFRSYAADVGPRILNALNNYTGYSYNTEKIGKVDQVALPDFAAGAMENWGLVTYRERLLLFDDQTTVDTVKRSIATIIAHEFAHQWFGNLITCDWWSETFLNEGFATYFEYFIAHEVENTWQLDKQFVVNVMQPVLESDSLENSQALKSEAETPQEISNKFGQITYNKGGSILRMLSHIMGEDNFKKSLQQYLQSEKFQHATVTSHELWEVFQENHDTAHSNLPEEVTINDVMESWIEQSGYPLLTVTLTETPFRGILVSQEKFLVSGQSPNATKWYVPITVISPTLTGATLEWLTPSIPERTVIINEYDRWILLDHLVSGFYRVNYDDTLWTAIGEALRADNFSRIDEMNRARIVDDLFNLAKAKKVTYSRLFDLIEFLKKDVSYFSWVSALNGFEYLLLRLPAKSTLKGQIEEHLLTLMDNFYVSTPIVENRTDQVELLAQTLANSWACKLAVEACVAETKQLFADYMDNGKRPNKNVKSLVYCYGFRYGSRGTDDYEKLWTVYDQTEDANEKLILLRALGCTQNSDQLKGLLEETLKQDSKIRPQDASTLFNIVFTSSDEGVEAALDFLIDRFDEIINKYSSMSARSTLIKGIAGRLNSERQIEKLRKLIADKSIFESDLRSLSEEALELATSNLNWFEDHERELMDYYGLHEDDDDHNGVSRSISPLRCALLITPIVYLLLL